MGRPKLSKERKGKKLCLRCKKWKQIRVFPKRPDTDGRKATCILCCRQASRESYQRHKPSTQHKQREYYLRNRKKIAKTHAAYYRKHKKEFQARAKRYVSNHRDEIRARQNELNRLYPHLAIARSHRRRALLSKARGHFTADQWLQLKAKYQFRCLWCGRKAGNGVKLVPDHIVPLCRGGSNSIKNIQPLCGKGIGNCNNKKNNSIIDFRPRRRLWVKKLKT